MIFDFEILETLRRQAVVAAREAGAIINAHRDLMVPVEHKATGTTEASQVVTEVDRKAQAAIVEALQAVSREFDLAILAEESPDDGLRHEKAAFWCIDPMDGTLAFVRKQAGFAVSIALVAQDGSPLIGVVHDPVGDVLYQAVRARGAWRNDVPIVLPRVDLQGPLVLQTDEAFASHPWYRKTQEGLEAIARNLGLSGAAIRFHIGAVSNACSILESANRCYFKYPRTGNGGGSLWDYAATACLFQEVGAIATDIEGRPMELNRRDSTFMNHRGLIFAINEDLAGEIQALFRGLDSGT